MTEKHTPGPWDAVEDIADKGSQRKYWHIEAQGGRFYVGAFDPRGSGPSSEEREANAQLISAAPGLLYACQIALEKLRETLQDGIDSPLFQECGELSLAIQKATGGTKNDN